MQQWMVVSGAMQRDPLTLLLDQETQRLEWLLPVRHSRMAESPFAYFRGAAAVMAADLARHNHSGLLVQLCGDAHLLNFGFFGSPERQLLFDINDFDETYPGPYEWDVVRLATSFLLAARSNGCGDAEQEAICCRALRSYAKAMHQFAAMPFMPMWVARLPLEALIKERGSRISGSTCAMWWPPLSSAIAGRPCASSVKPMPMVGCAFATTRRCSGGMWNYRLVCSGGAALARVGGASVRELQRHPPR